MKSESGQFVDLKAVSAGLQGIPGRFDLKAVEVTGSTNDDLLRDAGRCSGGTVLLLVAQRQTAGRGSHGRPWRNAGESLLFSMGFLLPSDIGLPLIPLIAGFSTAKALRSEGIPAMVRWPNDIWLGQGKLGGMLCESVKRSAESVFFVAGIGINLMAGEEKTPDAPYGRAYAGRSGYSPSELRTRLLGAIARQVISNVRAYVRTGIVPDRSLWPELDILKGREIILDNNAGSILRGRAAGIAESGALLIESEGEVRPCVSGTVRLPDEWGKGKGK